MWPFERARFVLRIGREWLDLWLQTGDGLTPVGEPIRLDPGAPDILVQAVTLLLTKAVAEGQSKVPPVDVVLESTCMPVLSLDFGDTLPDQAQIRALLHHRAVQIYGSAPIGGGNWEVIGEARTGAERGVGYALAPATKLALLTAAAAAHCKVLSIQPAFAWGRARFGRKSRHGWWLWCEQDRTLIAFMRHGWVCSLSAGAPRMVDEGVSVSELVSIESVRHGQGTETNSAFLAGWTRSELGDAARSQSTELLTLLVAAAPEVTAGKAITTSVISV